MVEYGEGDLEWEPRLTCKMVSTRRDFLSALTGALLGIFQIPGSFSDSACVTVTESGTQGAPSVTRRLARVGVVSWEHLFCPVFF